MKILYIGGYQQRSLASRYYDVAHKLVNGFTRNGHHVLHISDRDIARASNWLRSRKLGVGKANLVIQQMAKEFNPDLVIFMHAYVITPETVKFIQDNCQAKCVQINVDGLFVEGNYQRLMQHAQAMDACFVTTDGEILNELSEQSDGVPFYFMPLPVDKSIESHQAFKNTQPQHELFFACGSGEADPRIDTIKNIQQNLPELNVRFCVASEGNGLWGAEYMTTLGNCYMGLNGSRYQEKNSIGESKHLYHYSSDRITHYMGNGLLTFTHQRFAMQDLFGPEEMVTYTDDDDLITKLKYYSDHQDEGREIAKNGCQAIHEKYNAQKIAELILEKIDL